MDVTVSISSTTYETAAISRETIVALSSGAVPSAIAIVRLSGPRVRQVLHTLSGEVPPPRTATLRALRSRDGMVLDRALLLFFPSPASFTGEDLAELHLHGGRAVVVAVLREISSMPGCRAAEAGEFSRRALLNGKMDLLAAEATADLIQAETEAQRRFAITNTGSGHALLYAQWRKRLIHARAMIEADLDFSDEADVPGSVADTVWPDMVRLADEVRAHLAGFSRSEMIRNGFRVVLLGAPNAGKSSLLNALAKRDVAIVTDEPGTTRDAVDVTLDLEGVKVVVTDTAGIRHTQGKAEAIGITRAIERAGEADLVLLIEDMADPRVFDRPSYSADVVTIGTKSDIASNRVASNYDFVVSTIDGDGIADLLGVIANRASVAGANIYDGELIPWKQRHADLLTTALHNLQVAASNETQPIELRCEDLRAAGDAIGRIAGHVDVEDLLDVVFSQFCIGK